MKRPEGWNDSTDQTAGCASVWKSSGGLDGLCEVRTDRGGVSISMHEAPPEVVAYVLWKAGVIPDVLFRLVRRAAG